MSIWQVGTGYGYPPLVTEADEAPKYDYGCWIFSKGGAEVLFVPAAQIIYMKKLEDQ